MDEMVKKVRIVMQRDGAGDPVEWVVDADFAKGVKVGEKARLTGVGSCDEWTIVAVEPAPDGPRAFFAPEECEEDGERETVEWIRDGEGWRTAWNEDEGPHVQVFGDRVDVMRACNVYGPALQWLRDAVVEAYEMATSGRGPGVVKR